MQNDIQDKEEQEEREYREAMSRLIKALKPRKGMPISKGQITREMLDREVPPSPDREHRPV